MLSFVALAACSSAPEPPATSSQPAFYASLASPTARVDAVSARDLINIYRRGIGLTPVVLDDRLMAFAQRQANVMASAGATDATRARPLADRLAAAGIAAGTARENASAGYHTVSDAFSGWRGSARHDAAFRLAQGRSIGIATAYNPASRHKVYWTFVITD
jgi:uncharacterized protein YkwD